jgi:hypothetical protein
MTTKLNKEVKSTILDVTHREQLNLMNMEYHAKNVRPVVDMQHKLKPTLEKLMGATHATKVDDWVEVLYEYAHGTCSDGV